MNEGSLAIFCKMVSPMALRSLVPCPALVFNREFATSWLTCIYLLSLSPPVNEFSVDKESPLHTGDAQPQALRLTRTIRPHP